MGAGGGRRRGGAPGPLCCHNPSNANSSVGAPWPAASPARLGRGWPHVTRHTCHTPHITRHTSHISCHTCHTSHITHHISHITEVGLTSHEGGSGGLVAAACPDKVCGREHCGGEGGRKGGEERVTRKSDREPINPTNTCFPPRGLSPPARPFNPQPPYLPASPPGCIR